jgi:hypothetical protein
MSRWLIITISAIVIASVFTIGLVYFLLKNSDKEERAADEVYLRQKKDLLKLAVDKNMNDNTGILQVQSGNILKQVDATGRTVGKSNSKLAGLISEQKAAIAALKNKYETENNEIKASQ